MRIEYRRSQFESDPGNARIDTGRGAETHLPQKHQERLTMRAWIANLATVAVSLLVFTLACELIVFRFLLLPSDIPANAFIDGVVRHRPGQTGIFRLANEISVPYTINQRGWNSGHADYAVERTPGQIRVAVVGDSYVEALQVPSTESLAERIERKISPERAEVFRFGISGAPLSQYVYMVEHEVVQFAPDIVAIVLIHNDFVESFRFHPGRYTSSFSKLLIENGAVAGEIAPTPYRETWQDLVRQTALARYFYYRWHVTPQAVRVGFSRLFKGPDKGRFEANIDVAAMQDSRADVHAATDYLFARLKAIAEQSGFRLLLIMDGARDAIYHQSGSRSLELNKLAAEVAARHGIDFIDLHFAFATDWAANKQRFEFVADTHWNSRAHEVAAETVYNWLLKQQILGEK